jgi:hypothetical protein
MADSNRSRTMLMKNLPKKGWSIDGNAGTFKELRIDFGDNEWTIYKDDKPAVTGDYGRTQMADVRAACKSLGSPFDDDKSPAKSGPKPQTDKKVSAKEKQKAAMAKKQNKQAEAKPSEESEEAAPVEEKDSVDPEG